MIVHYPSGEDEAWKGHFGLHFDQASASPMLACFPTTVFSDSHHLQMSPCSGGSLNPAALYASLASMKGLPKSYYNHAYA